MIEFSYRGEVFNLLAPRQARVQSRRTEGVWYAIDADDRKGNGSCSCRGFEIRKRCRHLDAFKAFLAASSVEDVSDIDEAFPVTKEVA